MEDGKDRFRGDSCPCIRNFARNVRVFDHRLPGLSSRPKPPKATPKPPQGHILGIDSGVQSHPKATPRLHQGSTKAPPKPPQGSTKATLKPPQSLLIANRLGPQSHPKATLKPPQSHLKATPRLPQSYPKECRSQSVPALTALLHGSPSTAV